MVRVAYWGMTPHRNDISFELWATQSWARSVRSDHLDDRPMNRRVGAVRDRR